MPVPEKHPKALDRYHVFLQALAGLILVAAFPVSLLLPVRVSWENGPIEDAQVAILAAAAVLAFALGRRASSATRFLWFGVGIVWILLLGRELSWGAVFLDPIRTTDHGPTFSSSLLWYRPAVTPILAAAGAVAFGMIAWSRPVRVIRRLGQRRALPIRDILGFAAAMLISTAAEDHMGLTLAFWPGDLQILEEMVELSAYLFLFSGQAAVVRGLRDG